MTRFPSGIIALRLLWVSIIVCCPSLVIEGQHTSAQESIAHISVLVRNAKGNPVPGLKAEDFIVREYGQDDEIVSVQPLSGPYPVPGNSAHQKSVNTFILLIIPPMAISGHALALKSALAATADLSRCSCATSILGPTGESTSFITAETELRTALEKIKSQIAQPISRDAWLLKARQVIQDLSTLPGRHIILAATDYGSTGDRVDFNPWPIKVNPSSMVHDALQARASIYTIDTTGPDTVVPFGAASDEDQYSASGPALAPMLTNNTIHLDVLHSEVLASAANTGGQSEKSFKNAVKQIDRDNQGYYLLTFKPQQAYLDGSWHHISVKSRNPSLAMLAPRYYQSSLSDLAADSSPIPHPLIEAVQGGKEISGLAITEQLWLFPDGRRDGIYTLPFAVNIAPNSLANSKSPVQLYARLENVTYSLQVATWNVTLQPDMSCVAHWQQEVTVGPGIYKLQIAVRNADTGALRYKEIPFWVHSVVGQPIAASSILLSKNCQSSMGSGERRRISDPTEWNGCHPKLEPEERFKAGDQIHLLLRLYPENDNLQQSILKTWTARLLIDDTAVQNMIPLDIHEAEVRGLAVSGEITLAKFNLKPGLHNIAVIFEGPKKQKVEVETNFIVSDEDRPGS
jgi:VWFA-related protein